MRVTKTRFDQLCGRDRAVARLAESGAEPEPLFEIPGPRTERDESTDRELTNNEKDQ
ncbi:hypothetical protein Ae168Ps1_6422 [Pseudonocardia sp. Ae168_Ps1]|nr:MULTISPECIES: hypothetical protein [unclassified Pseudonocardia]OLL69944.1 hypothetical protein Ae168Ps1_6422 [Pseudonocardia sp. Ae168_Ps1]OLL69997.1 hypothetical protein Ae263Ps1_6389 [Pseudonocardia sp. Ae263_Ps1]OLL89011.1 hypothetical protein Ae356Ps1_6338c [Pseudonocardia sp. Ae356_Ps1]OLM08410.1 Single-stranded DNA-binding protein [Pseudonocardia sp. Ae505_Ps2]